MSCDIKIRKAGILKDKIKMSEDFDSLDYQQKLRDEWKSREQAILRLRKLAKEMNLGKFDWEEFKSYRDEGRK
jgi:hypothetical protein